MSFVLSSDLPRAGARLLASVSGVAFPAVAAFSLASGVTGVTGASAAFAAAPPASSPAAPAATPAPRPIAELSAQQLFDVASQDAAQEHCPEAVEEFSALEARGKIKPTTLVASAIRVRKGVCLETLGRDDEALAAIAAGLPMLEKAGASFGGDVLLAHRALGDIAYHGWDYETAAAEYRQALALQTGIERVPLLVDLTKATVFDPGDEALKAIDEAIALTKNVGQDKETRVNPQAVLLSLRGRVLFNHRQVDAGYADLQKALEMTGGLGLRVSLNDVVLRSDLAIVAYLAGRTDEARKYLSYTGAGRIAESPFDRAVAMELPVCGGPEGLRPDDYAIVEFGISGDGSVTSAQPVYSSRGRDAGLAFARAVGQWYWDAGTVAKIPAFFRTLTRVEVRCSMSGADRPDIFAPVAGRFSQWATEAGYLAPGDGVADSASQDEKRIDRMARLRLAMAEAEASGKTVRAIVLTSLLADRGDMRSAVAVRDGSLVERAQKAGLPAEQIDWLKIQAAIGPVDGKTRVASLKALQADPAIQADPQAAAVVRLVLVQMKAGGTAMRNAWLSEVVDEPGLSSASPLRQAALLQLASVAAGKGEADEAQKLFRATGLSEEQCGLIGIRPARKSAPVSYSDYPERALERGFEGWVNLEYDIGADGKPGPARPVVAYPPFLFNSSAAKLIQNVRYESSFRPSGSAACSANRETVRFHLYGH